MKKLTYHVEDDEETLLRVTELTEAGFVLKLSEKVRNVMGVTLNEYNADNLLIKTSRYENDILLNVVENTYNDQGDITEQQLLIGEEVYETISTRYCKDGHTRITVQDGEETERMVYTGDDKNYRIEFWEEGELVQTQVGEEDPRENSLMVTTMDNDQEVTGRRVEKYDKQGWVILEQMLSASDHLLSESTHEFDGQLLIKTKSKDFLHPEENYILTHFYDENAILLKTETRELDGKLLGFHTFGYDEYGRCIDEVELLRRSSDIPFSEHKFSEPPLNIHLIHRYEE